MKKTLQMSTLVLIIAALAIYLADAVFLAIRIQHGTGYKTIEVNQFLATPLKGQKEQFDAVGSISVTCVQSIFPQHSLKPCWWVERHTAEWQ